MLESTLEIIQRGEIFFQNVGFSRDLAKRRVIIGIKERHNHQWNEDTANRITI